MVESRLPGVKAGRPNGAMIAKLGEPGRGGDVIQVSESIAISEAEFAWSFVRSGGPGGQNVNKVASKAVLRWNVAASPSVPEHVKSRLMALQRRRVTNEGDLVLTAQRYRDQERNRQDCVEKLVAIVREAAEVPKPRRATRPTRGSKTRRLEAKRHRSVRKAERRNLDED